MQPPAARTRPIQKFAAAASKCSAEVSFRKTSKLPQKVPLTILQQAAVYGKCIVVDYNSVHKDKCAAEFLKLKDCYIVRILHTNVPHIVFRP